MRLDRRWSSTLLATGFALLLWAVAFACFRAPGLVAGRAAPLETLYLLATSAIGFVLSGAVYLAAARMERGWTPTARVAATAVLLAALVLIHASIDLWMIERYLRPKLVLPEAAWVTGRGLLLINNLITLAPVYLTYAIGLGLGFSLRAIREREQRLAAALAAQQEAQLAALRFQINPHFLFNSLNALTSLVRTGRNQEAEAVVERLAEFFRATTSTEPLAMVTLEEEMDVVGAYLDIEAARFGDRLAVEIDLPETLATARTPHFLLQPLVENAIKHAVAPSKRRVTLRIAAGAEDGALRLSVSDDAAGAGPAAAGTGVGLKNVRARLAALYGDQGRLSAGRTATGYRAEVTLPLVYEGEG